MAEFKKSIKYIENFIFAYTGMAKRQANIYETAFSKLAIKLRSSNSKSETNKIIKEYLYDEFNKRYIAYDEFEESFINLIFTKKRVKNNIITKYAIENISIHMETTPREYFWDNSSIEHIINEDFEDKTTLSIGNLIVLETNLNNEAGSLDYSKK